jgi:hypothetical protein
LLIFNVLTIKSLKQLKMSHPMIRRSHVRIEKEKKAVELARLAENEKLIHLVMQKESTTQMSGLCS